MKIKKTELDFISKFSQILIPALKKESDKIAKAYFAHDFTTSHKPGKSSRDHMDLVTSLDEEVESSLYELLHKQFPELGFNVEEHKQWSDMSSEFNCYLDPIDGTKYFAKQIPLFSTQVGLSYQGEPVFGMVINPLTFETYIGSELMPSQRNQKEISVSRTSSLKDSMINVGVIPFRDNWNEEQSWVFDKQVLLEKSSYRVRKLASSALILSWVAQGGLDAAVFLVANPEYDTMAGQALIKYASGKAEKINIPGLKEPRLICANDVLFEEIKDLLLL